MYPNQYSINGPIAFFVDTFEQRIYKTGPNTKPYIRRKIKIIISIFIALLIYLIADHDLHFQLSEDLSYKYSHQTMILDH